MLVGGGIAGGGLLLSWLCRVHPVALPFWLPSDFSWPEYLGATLPLWWFARGLARAASAERPVAWRRVCFLTGVAATYAVLQTHFDDMAQHMFFLNRIQHVVMHHVGPFLIALSGCGPTVWRGVPCLVRQSVTRRPMRVMTSIVQQPVIAVMLFAGLFYLWLVPPIAFRAMIDPRLYAVMNWSMVIDGLLFWMIVLDRRPSPPSRLSFGVRAAMVYATTFPEILIGYYLTSVPYDLYPYYALCGRLYPSIGGLMDQRLGAIITWVVPAMMSAAGTLLVAVAFLAHDEAAAVGRERSGH